MKFDLCFQKKKKDIDQLSMAVVSYLLFLLQKVHFNFSFLTPKISEEI